MKRRHTNIPQAKAKVLLSGIMCFKPRSWGLATSSKSRNWEPGIRLDRYSDFAFLGEFGMNQVESRTVTGAEDFIRSLTCFGDRSNGVIEDIFRAWKDFDSSCALLCTVNLNMSKLWVTVIILCFSPFNGSYRKVKYLPLVRIYLSIIAVQVYAEKGGVYYRVVL